MDRDIVDRLRDSQPAGTSGGFLLNDAADEISRLREGLALVSCREVLSELSSELDKWLSGARFIPDTVHNRAVRNAVSVVADAVAITRARFDARQRDISRNANAERDPRFNRRPRRVNRSGPRFC